MKAADLRGSMTVQVGAAFLGMEVAAFKDFMEIPQDVPDGIKLSSVKDCAPGFDFHAVKARK